MHLQEIWKWAQICLYALNTDIIHGAMPNFKQKWNRLDACTHSLSWMGRLPRCAGYPECLSSVVHTKELTQCIEYYTQNTLRNHARIWSRLDTHTTIICMTLCTLILQVLAVMLIYLFWEKILVFNSSCHFLYSHANGIVKALSCLDWFPNPNAF